MLKLTMLLSLMTQFKIHAWFIEITKNLIPCYSPLIYFVRCFPTPPSLPLTLWQEYNRQLITGCSRFLTFFCRIGLPNQKCVNDQVNYFLDTGKIGLCKLLVSNMAGVQWLLVRLHSVATIGKYIVVPVNLMIPMGQSCMIWSNHTLYSFDAIIKFGM